jgi:hypothetical protein
MSALADGWYDRWQAMMARLDVDADEANAALAGAEARGRQWAIDTLRDTAAYDAWVRSGMRDGSRYRSQWGAGDVIYAADYLEAMATEEEANRG